MTTKERIKLAIKNSRGEVCFDTGNPFYDSSYKILVGVGSRLKSGTATNSDIVFLVGALLAWNQGAKHADKVSRLITLHESKGETDFKLLVNKLTDIESSSIDIKSSKKTIQEILGLSQLSLGMKSVVMPSKLIHFISPDCFAMTDSNISKGLGESINSESGYVKYIQGLWEMGFHKRNKNEELADYWSDSSDGITPMRAVDCTFYTLGKIKAN